MRDFDSVREPINEFDVAQQEEALRRSGNSNKVGSGRNSGRSRDRGHASVTFFFGETLTLKGKRFRVAQVIGGRSVVLEPIGEIELKDGRDGVGRRKWSNVVGRRK